MKKSTNVHYFYTSVADIVKISFIWTTRLSDAQQQCPDVGDKSQYDYKRALDVNLSWKLFRNRAIDISEHCYHY